ncbi:MAG: hypothetical protein KGL94_11760 [Acidobacteriota bacterium]|nr:hypothetical protein [Acidobacteriota bacterium]
MPTRKQKRREAKAKRHDYEFVYVDDEGNEVEPPPGEERSGNGVARPAAKKAAAAPARGARRAPSPPSWQRAGRRALILGVVVFFLFTVLNKSHGYAGPAFAAVIYTVLFVPFTYMLDRFAYKRWQVRQQQTPAPKR